MELMVLLQMANVKMYPKWNKGKVRDGKPHISAYSVSDCPEYGNRWLEAQGIHTEQPFSPHCGRYALGRWLSETGCSYEEGFQIHMDLWTTWSQSYQDDCQNANGFKNRIQSRNPDRCLTAYKKLRKHWGIVQDQPAPLTRTEKMLMAMLKSNGMPVEALKELMKG